ncbi:hypothetical protein GGX14DRAFT_643522 [Mycena pura]|uniref:HMG box domain-containing protein n=1 Tax=Mycena pura TaxID=153505 RepID=A0AAD6V990_9AGAR|nr:hypothetical protein GGX14DRAFT_643522 [Mycena pura]
METADYVTTFAPFYNNLPYFSFVSSHNDKYHTLPPLPPHTPTPTASPRIRCKLPQITPSPYPEDGRRVKRPPNAYMLFRSWCCQNRAVNIGGKHKNLNTTIPALWNALSSARRAQWMGLANEMKKEHETQYRPRRRNANSRVSVAVSSTTSLPQHGSAKLPPDQANAVHDEPNLRAVSGSFLPALSSASPMLTRNDWVPFPASSAIGSTSFKLFSPSFSPVSSFGRRSSSSISNSWPSSQHISVSSSAALDIPHNTLSNLASMFTGPSVAGGDPYVYAMPSPASATNAARTALSESGTEFDVNRILGRVSQPFSPGVATSDNEIMIYFGLGEPEQGGGIWPWELAARTDEISEAPVGDGAPYDNLPLAAAAFGDPSPTPSSLLEPTFTDESVAEGDSYVNAASSSTTIRPGAGHSNLDFDIEHIMEHPFLEAEVLDNAVYFEVDEHGAIFHVFQSLYYACRLLSYAVLFAFLYNVICCSALCYPSRVSLTLHIFLRSHCVKFVYQWSANVTKKLMTKLKMIRKALASWQDSSTCYEQANPPQREAPVRFYEEAGVYVESVPACTRARLEFRHLILFSRSLMSGWDVHAGTYDARGVGDFYRPTVDAWKLYAASGCLGMYTMHVALAVVTGATMNRIQGLMLKIERRAARKAWKLLHMPKPPELERFSHKSSGSHKLQWPHTVEMMQYSA